MKTSNSAMGHCVLCVVVYGGVFLAQGSAKPNQ